MCRDAPSLRPAEGSPPAPDLRWWGWGRWWGRGRVRRRSGAGREGRDTEGLTAGRGQWVELLGLLQETLGLFTVAGVQGLPGDLDTFLRLIPIPLHGWACAFFRFLRERGYEGRKPPPRRRGRPGLGREEASGEERRDRSPATGGVAAPPPSGGLPAPSGPPPRELPLLTPDLGVGADPKVCARSQRAPSLSTQGAGDNSPAEPGRSQGAGMVRGAGVSH